MFHIQTFSFQTLPNESTINIVFISIQKPSQNPTVKSNGFSLFDFSIFLIHQKTLIMCQMLSAMHTFKTTFSGRLQDFLMRLYFLEKAKSIFLMGVGIKYFFVKECFHHVYPQINGKIMQWSTDRICSINLPTFNSKLGTCHFLKIFAGQPLFNTLKIKCKKTSNIN